MKKEKLIKQIAGKLISEKLSAFLIKRFQISASNKTSSQGMNLFFGKKK
jgi:hypothetical protein